jgi:hypothetical protein
VTLSDEEARRRGTQKTVLERKAPPTFDVVVEIQDWHHLAVHHDVAKAVDAILRGRSLPAEIRYRDEEGKVQIEKATLPPPSLSAKPIRLSSQPPGAPSTLRVYPYGIGQNRLKQAAQNLRLPVAIVKELGDADVVITLKNYYRKRPQPISKAEQRGVPIYVLRSNTVTQMESCLADIFELETEVVDPFAMAMGETQEAIQKVLSGARVVELSPQSAYVRRQQHQMARKANLISHSRGREPHRRVRIYQNNR